jgi:hypothetical protein
MMHRMDDDEFLGWMAYYELKAEEDEERREKQRLEQEKIAAQYNKQ